MKLHTITTGSGTQTIALVHGISGEAAIFEELAVRLAERYNATVTAVDLRGHGLSPRADDYSLAAFADDLVDTLPTGMDVIMGHSLGAKVLLDSVERLLPQRAVYLDPAFDFSLADPGELAGRGNVSEHEDGTPFSADELAALNPGWGEENLARALRSHDHWDSSMFEYVIGQMPTVPFTTRPVVPSLVIFGGESPLGSPALQEQLRGTGWTVRVQQGAGHNIHLDDVEATLRELDGWI